MVARILVWQFEELCHFFAPTGGMLSNQRCLPSITSVQQCERGRNALFNDYVQSQNSGTTAGCVDVKLIRSGVRN